METKQSIKREYWSLNADGSLLHAQHPELVEWSKNLETSDKKTAKTEFYELFDKVVSSDLISSNEEFIQTLVNEAIKNEVDELVFMVGSLRQCRSTDIRNGKMGTGNSNGSFFLALTAFSEEVSKRITKRLQTEKNNRVVKVYVDPYLLSDDHLKQPHGTNFSDKSRIAILGTPQFYPDVTRLTLVTAQTNKAGSANESLAVVENFNFCDDRLDILDELGNVYKKDAANQLIPINIKLRLHHYAGKELTLKHEIRGAGRPDNTFSNSTQLIIANTNNEKFQLEKYKAPESSDTEWGKTLTTHFNVEAFLKARAEYWEISSTSLASLKGYVNANRQNALGEALLDLHSSLSADIQKQEQAKASLADLNKSSAVAICAETVKMLEKLNELPSSASVEAKIAIIKNYDAACREIPGSREFAHIIKAVVIAALCFALYSVVLMGIFDFMGGADLISEFLSGFIDIVKGHMTDAAVPVIVTQAAGVGLAIFAGYLFFKPDKITAVVDAAKDVVYAQSSISAPEERQPNTVSELI